MEKYGDDNLVLVFLGDHQPAPVVTGANAEPGRADHDRGQGPGRAGPDLRLGLEGRPAPGPTAPVWRMDAFRDRFLTAFGSTPTSR